MAIPLGTNDLKIYGRHASYCTRYPTLKNKPDTYRPATKKDQKADTCGCPIWCRGYLAKETKIVKGKLGAKRTFASLDTSDWTAAEQEVARLYERGSLPSVESAVRQIDNSAITVRYAAERYLQSRKDGSLNSIEKDTYDHDASPINQRLIPFCDEKGIVSIRDFENKDVCSQFTESSGNSRGFDWGDSLAQMMAFRLYGMGFGDLKIVIWRIWRTLNPILWLLVAVPAGMAQTTPPVTSSPQASACGLGVRWEGMEQGWRPVWTRRGQSDVFDAVWTKGGGGCPPCAETVTITARGNQVVVQRQDQNHVRYFYEGVIGPDGVTVTGS